MKKTTLIIAVGALAIAAIGLLLAWPILSKMPDQEAPIASVPLQGGAYSLTGDVATTAFVVAERSVIAVDPQMFAGTARKGQQAIASVTPKPIRYMILTHSDPDHVNGLPFYPRGIEVIAHPNTQRDIIEVTNQWWPSLISPPKEIIEYLPTRLVEKAADIVLDGVPLQIRHFGPAHTDGDLIVFLPRQKIVLAGDILAPEIGEFPGIHLEKNGSSLGWIHFVEKMLELDADLFVPAHGEPLKRAAVKKRLATAKSRRAEIAALVVEGNTLEEIKAKLGDRPLPGIASMFPTFVETTYQELAK